MCHTATAPAKGDRPSAASPRTQDSAVNTTVRQAEKARVVRSFMRIPPLALSLAGAADLRSERLVPGDVVPEPGELRMSEVRGAVEPVAVLRPQAGADLSRFFDDVPGQRRVIQPVDGAPAFGVAHRLLVAAAKLRHFGHVAIHPFSELRLVCGPILEQSCLHL